MSGVGQLDHPINQVLSTNQPDHISSLRGKWAWDPCKNPMYLSSPKAEKYEFHVVAIVWDVNVVFVVIIIIIAVVVIFMMKHYRLEVFAKNSIQYQVPKLRYLMLLLLLLSMLLSSMHCCHCHCHHPCDGVLWAWGPLEKIPGLYQAPMLRNLISKNIQVFWHLPSQ